MLILNFPNGEHGDFPIQGNRVLIGAAESNDLVLRGKGMEPNHAELWKEGEAVVLVNRSSCQVNGAPVEERCRLLPGDRITLGTVQIEVKEAPDAVVPAPGVEDPFSQTAKFHVVHDGWVLKCLTGAPRGRSFSLEGKAVIGRHPDSDIFIEDPEVSRHHAELEPRGNRVILKDLGSTNGTRVNGQLVTHAILKPGDKFSVDLTTFQLEGGEEGNQTLVRAPFQPSVSDREEIARPRLVIRDGSSAGRIIPLTKNKYSIGRTADNDIVLDDSSVSRLHASLLRVGNGWQITDLGSTNGISVNGSPATESGLQNGDRVRLGRVRLVLEDRVEKPSGNFDSSATISRQVNQGLLLPWWRRWVWAWVGFAALALAVLWWYSRVGDERSQIRDKLQVAKLWERDLGSRFRQPLTPALEDINRDGFLDIVVGSGDGFLAALDGEAGKVIFVGEMAGQLVAPPVVGDVNGDGIRDVLAGTYRGRVYALNGEGQVLWNTRDEDALGAVLNRSVVWDLDGDGTPEILVPSASKGLVALDGKHGWELWNSASVSFPEVVSVPQVSDFNGDGKVEISVIDRGGRVMQFQVDGDRLWKLWAQKLPSYRNASPTVVGSEDGRYLVTASESHGLFGHYPNSGLVAWQAKLDGTALQDPLPVALEGDWLVVVADDLGVVSAVDAKTGALRWRYSLGNPVNAPPALADLNGDGLPESVFLDQAGVLSILDNAQGHLLFSEKLLEEKKNAASPVLGDVNNDAMLDIVSVSDQGTVTAIALNRRVTKGHVVWPRHLGY